MKLFLLHSSNESGSSERRLNAFSSPANSSTRCWTACCSCSNSSRKLTIFRSNSDTMGRLWKRLQNMWGQHLFLWCTITQPRGGGTGCSWHTLKEQSSVRLAHWQLRQGSMVGTSEPSP